MSRRTPKHRHRKWQRVGWRFHRVKPGMVWVSDQWLIDHLRAAYDVTRRELELTLEIAQIQAETRRLDARHRAMQLLYTSGRSGLSAEVRSSPLPVTDDGRLHEPAFLAYVEELAWARRDRALAEVLAGAAGPS